jgi:peptidoglycan/LPS O-acetylase OafA/YrhL
MVPRLFWRGFVDGVYWTLAYELTFYFGVFLIIILGAQRYLQKIFLVWPLIFFTSLFLELTELPFLGGYYYYFAAGTLFGILSVRRQPIYMIPILAMLSLCIYFSAGNAVSQTNSNNISYSEETISLIVITMFAFFAFISNTKGSSIRLPYSAIIGSLTYTVYLIHAHFGYIILNRFATQENKFIVYLLLVPSVLIIAYIIHMLIEVKLAVFWRKLFSSTLGAFVIRLEKFISLQNKPKLNLKN